MDGTFPGPEAAKAVSGNAIGLPAARRGFRVVTVRKRRFGGPYGTTHSVHIWWLLGFVPVWRRRFARGRW